MFFKLAMRLYCYAGVMQQRVIAEQQDESPSTASAPTAPRGHDVNPGTQATLLAAPEFAGVFSFG